MKIDLATVIYHDELNFLETQARSIELYFPRENIGNIFVIINHEPKNPHRDETIPCVVDPNWYGINADKVRIIDFHQWGYENTNVFDSMNAGWQNQQICKLLISAECQHDWYCVLDAKTWFIQPIDLSKVFTNNKFHCRTTFDHHPKFRESVNTVNGQFGIDIQECITPGGVPFFFHRQTVLDMINHIETISNPEEKFYNFFLRRCKVEHIGYITEFILYTGYIIFKYKSITHLYQVGTQHQTLTPVNIDARNLPENGCWANDLLDHMQDPKTTTVSIHKDTLAKLTPYQLKRWADFLTEKNLIKTP